MKIYQGADRVVIVGEKHTFKFPKAHPLVFAKTVQRHFRRGGLHEALDAWTKWTPDHPTTLKHQLLHGLVANRRESRIAKASSIVTPTRSMLGGLVNIQDSLLTPEVDAREIHRSFAEYLGQEVVHIGHMLENPSNFGVDEIENCVRFVDGGSAGLEELVLKYSPALQYALGSVAVGAGRHPRVGY